MLLQKMDIDVVFLEFYIWMFSEKDQVLNEAILRNGKDIMVENVIIAPDTAVIKHYKQPIVITTIMYQKYSPSIFQLCDARKGRIIDQEKYDKQDLFTFLNEIIQDLFDKIKSATKVYGFLEHEFFRFEKANIVKLIVHLMDDPVDTLSFKVPVESARSLGKKMPKIKRKYSQISKVGGKVITDEKNRDHREKCNCQMVWWRLYKKEKGTRSTKGKKIKNERSCQSNSMERNFYQCFKID